MFKDKEKMGEKKMKVAKKMFRSDELDERRGKGFKTSKNNRQEFNPQDNFSEKDEAKERKEKRNSNGKEPKSDWLN